MDDPDVPDALLESALYELPRINAWLGGYRATLSTLEAYRRTIQPRTLRILDVGTGIGDYPAKMVRWGMIRGIDVRVTALDVNAKTIRFARAAAGRLPEPVRSRIEFMVGDALDLRMRPDSFDVCTSALFLHHLSDGQATKSIEQMMRVASSGIIVNDIHRHPVSYYGIRLATAALPFSQMVRNDAPVSVRRAFTRSEMLNLATAAGVSQREVRWHWAFRWVLTNLPQAR